MRFVELDLREYGPFSQARPIRFESGPPGLNLVLGPNEAGKSTALRAIRALLFGFPRSTEDIHGRKYDALRVGGTIRSESRAEISFVRRKKDLYPLWKFDDSVPIAADALAPYLGGLDEEKFNDLFSMDHLELVKGGQAILKGGGRIGEMLFAAGSGLASVPEVRKKLDDEMDRLFRPRASTSSINAAITELSDQRRAVEKAMLATSAWVELDETIARERSRKEAIDDQIRQVAAEKRRLERLRDALPVIGKIDRVQAQLDELGHALVLSEGFADRRRDAEAGRKAGRKAAEAAELALEVVARELEALGPRDRLLDETDAIRRVRDDLGLYRKALEDRPVEQIRLARRQADAVALIAELRPGTTLDDAGSLRISAVLKGRIQGLSQELAALQTSRSSAEGEIAKLLAANPGADRQSQGLNPDAPRRAEALGESIRQIQAQGDLEAQLASAIVELAKLEAQSTIDRLALPLWSGSLEALEALAVPSITTIDQFENQFREVKEALDRVELDLAKIEAEKAAIDRAIDRQQASGSVPTEEDLAHRRRVRDETWQEVRRAWLDREPVETPANLADEFEAASKASDELADRLRREAEAVASQTHRLWQRRELQDRIAQATQARDRAIQARDAVRRSWLESWKPIGIEPLSPREMKDWVAIRRADLVRQAKALRDRRLERDRIASKIAESKAEIGRPLELLGEPAVEPGETLNAVLARAKSTKDRVSAGLNLHEARTVQQKAEEALADAKARWATAVGPLGLEADASPTQVQAVIERFDDLAKLLREIADSRGKVEGQVQVETRFEAQVRSLIDRLRIESAGDSLESVAIELDDRLKGALVVEARRDESVKRQEAERSKLEKARQEVDRAEASLEALVAEAGCESPEGLIEAIRISDAIKDLRKQQRSLEEQLQTLGGLGGVEKFRKEAEGIDLETIETRVEELAEQLSPLEIERDRLAEEIGRCRQRLEAMDGGPAAADAQQIVEERVARLAIDVERYARLRLASAILREAVERYRKEHQGPVLDRAAALFASLTVGSFGGLVTDLDDKGEPVLLGVRANGTPLKVEAMSEGTADQLYLALRLASLQTYLDDHEPMPLVVDDILVNFDNARALAALQALTELSQRTQILFFTHHEHLVDLARSHLPAEAFRVHHLTYPPVSMEVLVSETTKPKRQKKALLPTDE